MPATDTPSQCHNNRYIVQGKTAPGGYFAVIQLKKPAVMVKGTGQNIPSLESRQGSQLHFWLKDTWLVANTGSIVRDIVSTAGIKQQHQHTETLTSGSL